MKGNKHIKIIILFVFISLVYAVIFAYSSQTSCYTYDHQHDIIISIMQREEKIKNLKKIINIVNQIDNIYGNLFKKLAEGGKLTIFFDPAHGKLENGKWEGIETGRVSCTNLPEEIYSIMFSRRLYKYLSSNKYIDVKSTDDFLQVIKGESNTYKNIFFVDTVKMAQEQKAFIILSEHLNNISSIYKASGRVDMSGIHVTVSENGDKYLNYKEGIHNGFLTLYNKYDVTGFSKKYASTLKKQLIAKGMKPNSWEYGTVADDRFTYFVNYPISIIFENGFISNPYEEARLVQSEYQDKFAESQYKAFLESLKDIWGIDISGSKIRKTGDYNKNYITLLKLSRIAIYYIKSSHHKEAVSIIETMEDKYNKGKYRSLIQPYIEIKKCLIKAEKYFKKGMRVRKAKKFAGKYLKKAISLLKDRPIFSSYNEKYTESAGELQLDESLTSETKSMSNIVSFHKVRKSKLTTPVILPIQPDQTLEQAIFKALSPDKRTVKKILTSLRRAKTYRRVKVKVYSKKRKKFVFHWKWSKRRVRYRRGIYIVRFNNNLTVKHIKRVNRVPLNFLEYQNHQYLQNSFFASQKKQKSL
ncbi:MAG: N-acetylmuramoyl-L-alanine amidase [Spirochaetota bacterium]|nr:N-acetylmuramoyl-L-alanine amidase [Spirochaetota bacterium]